MTNYFPSGNIFYQQFFLPTKFYADFFYFDKVRFTQHSIIFIKKNSKENSVLKRKIEKKINLKYLVLKYKKLDKEKIWKKTCIYKTNLFTVAFNRYKKIKILNNSERVKWRSMSPTATCFLSFVSSNVVSLA